MIRNNDKHHDLKAWVRSRKGKGQVNVEPKGTRVPISGLEAHMKAQEILKELDNGKDS